MILVFCNYGIFFNVNDLFFSNGVDYNFYKVMNRFISYEYLDY